MKLAKFSVKQAKIENFANEVPNIRISRGFWLVKGNDIS